MPLFKRLEKKIAKQEALANFIDEKNTQNSKRRLKARAKLRIRVEKNGDFGIGPQLFDLPYTC